MYKQPGFPFLLCKIKNRFHRLFAGFAAGDQQMHNSSYNACHTQMVNIEIFCSFEQWNRNEKLRLICGTHHSKIVGGNNNIT